MEQITNITNLHFNYCSTILLNLQQENLHVLQVLQNRCMRAILSCDPQTHRQDMLENLGWLSVKQSIIYRVIIFISDILRTDTCDFKQYLRLNSDVYNYDTRGSTNFYMPIQNNNSGQKSLFVNGLKCFNELPKHIKEILPQVSKAVFKSILISYIKCNIPFI
jgi:hypothetical protein